MWRPERFLQLYTGDQTAAVIFVPEAAFREVAADLRIPLESDPMDPIVRGVAYEQLVQSELMRLGEQERREKRPAFLRRLLSRLSGREVEKD